MLDVARYVVHILHKDKTKLSNITGLRKSLSIQNWALINTKEKM